MDWSAPGWVGSLVSQLWYLASPQRGVLTPAQLFFCRDVQDSTGWKLKKSTQSLPVVVNLQFVLLQEHHNVGRRHVFARIAPYILLHSKGDRSRKRWNQMKSAATRLLFLGHESAGAARPSGAARAAPASAADKLPATSCTVPKPRKDTAQGWNFEPRRFCQQTFGHHH